MSRRDQEDISSSSGTLREQRYEVGQKPILASPIHDAQDEHWLRSRQNLSPHYAVAAGARKDVQHLGSHHNFSPRDHAVEGARKDEQYSPSHHNFIIPLATIGGSRKDEQYSHHNFSPRWATAGVARKDELYSRSHHNFSSRQAAVEGARKDEPYSRPHHNFSPCPDAVEGARQDKQYSHSQHGFHPRDAATKGARLNRDRDKREYEMHRRQDRVDQFYSSPRGSRPGGRLEQRSPVDERELYHMSQPSRRYDYPECADYDEDAISRTPHGYEYKDYRPMSTSKQDSSERRLRACSPHGAFKNNLGAVEESIDSHAARQQHQDYLLASGYRKSSQGYSPVKIQSFRKESQYYSNNMAPGNSAMENRYEEKEDYINKSRDDPHHSSFKSCYRNSGHQQMLSKGNSSTSSGLYERNGHADAFLDSNTVPPFVEHSRKYGNLTEPRGPHENCCTRPHLDLKKDHRVGYADMNYHQHGHTFSKHEDYLYENSGGHKDVPAAWDGGYQHRPVIRNPTAESGMVEAEGSGRMDRSDAVDNYNDPGYTLEHDRKHLHRPFLEEPFAESGLVIADDSQRILRSRAGANKDEPGCISNDDVYSIVPVHDQTGGHRYLRRQFMEEPIAQSGVPEAERFQRSHRSSAGGGEYDPNYISMDGIFQAEPDHGYLQRADMEEPTSQIDLEGAEGSQPIYHSSAMREYEIIRDEENRNLHTLKNSEYYLDFEDTSADFVRRTPQNDRSFGLGYQPEDEIYSYNYRRYANASSQRDRFKHTPEFLEDLSNQKDFGRGEKVKADERFMFDRPLKRKYGHDEVVGGTNSGSVRLRKSRGTSEARGVDSHVGRQGYKSNGGDGLHPNTQSRNKCNFYLEAEKIFDEIYRHQDSGRLNCSSSFLGKWENVQKQDFHEDSRRYSRSSSHQGKWKNVRVQDRKPFESGKKHFKGHLLSESSRRFDRSLHLNKRGHSYKPQNFVDRISEDSGHKDVTQSANLVEDEDLLTHNLSEDSEAFKQKVNGAFLIFSKKLNENTPLRRLYKDQGRSGTLFCIVCGRSASKEFQDSERLARHAYMCHKAGLRHQHLGLFRAICVLMGWETEVAKDVVTWLPQPLPYPMAMGQKEDLIIWQPILIIHNISLSNNNHKEWKVISIDALGEIIRGKSFIKSRINICLGCPGDQSVMVVKFMATYSGLLEAEKLHKYFAERGHGRRDFEKVISDMGESREIMVPEAVDGETLNLESLLYGYMGIAEDLDKIDLDSKRRCKIKSKQEIQDIADAPLRT